MMRGRWPLERVLFALCEQVCGSLQSQLSTLAALVGGRTT